MLYVYVEIAFAALIPDSSIQIKVNYVLTESGMCMAP